MTGADEPGVPCSPDGRWSFDANGNVMVCQGGYWGYPLAPDPVRPLDPLFAVIEDLQDHWDPSGPLLGGIPPHGPGVSGTDVEDVDPPDTKP
jgi:hypothetical protein